jgi:predicted enzyme related to lactoylglutathione lyase
MNRFCAYALRTTDVEAAGAFYTTILGQGFFSDGLSIGPLPPAALARGAVPHWLGHISVDDVSTTTERFIARGASPLGPATGTASTLRDPSGAVLAISSSATGERDARVAWHVLHAHDEQAAAAVYADVFGWTPLPAREPLAHEGHQLFAWNSTSTPAGIIANTARLPDVHAHWLFFFATDDLDGALDAVRANGGRALPAVTAYGRRLAPCEDAQGAAFGLSAP